MRATRAVGYAGTLMLAVWSALGVVGVAGAGQATPGAAAGALPANLAVPAGSVVVFSIEAHGVQIYDCAEPPDAPGTFDWVFRAPEAELLNAAGEPIGRHFAGPIWEGSDGSAVVGEVVERADAPAPGAIPWLLLAATDHEGSGLFGTVTHVQRLDTAGGAAPETGCDEDRAGEEARIDYTATYAFAYPAAGTPVPQGG